MLTRLVRMEFGPEEVERFLTIWMQNRDQIGAFDGCRSVQLLQDEQDPCVFYTLSLWEGPAALEAYRRSDLFADVWRRTRALFAIKAQAFSMMPPPPDPVYIAS